MSKIGNYKSALFDESRQHSVIVCTVLSSSIFLYIARSTAWYHFLLYPLLVGLSVYCLRQTSILKTLKKERRHIWSGVIFVILAVGVGDFVFWYWSAAIQAPALAVAPTEQNDNLLVDIKSQNAAPKPAPTTTVETSSNAPSRKPVTISDFTNPTIVLDGFTNSRMRSNPKATENPIPDRYMDWFESNIQAVKNVPESDAATWYRKYSAIRSNSDISLPLITGDYHHGGYDEFKFTITSAGKQKQAIEKITAVIERYYGAMPQTWAVPTEVPERSGNVILVAPYEQALPWEFSTQVVIDGDSYHTTKKWVPIEISSIPKQVTILVGGVSGGGIFAYKLYATISEGSRQKSYWLQHSPRVVCFYAKGDCEGALKKFEYQEIAYDSLAYPKADDGEDSK